MTIKDLKYLEINSVNHLYLIFSKVNRYFKVSNLILVPANESYEKIKNMKNCEFMSEIELGQ